jgi:hypothetical protein
MKEKVVVGGSTVSAGQLEDFFRQIKDGSIGSKEMQAILEHRNPWPEMNLGLWTAFYQKHFNLVVDFTGLKIPAKPATDEWRLLVILKGLMNNQVYEVCQKQFLCWKHTGDLNTAFPKNERNTQTGTYAIWVRDTVEADEVHQNKSTIMIKEAGIRTETLLERMIHELAFFSETGKHLDVINITLCSGSRDSDGFVPCAHWFESKFQVFWQFVGSQNGDLRAREVVSVS